MKTTIKIKIKSTPAKVFYWLENPNRATKWMTSVSKTEIVEQTPSMVGTTFREYIEEDGRGTEMSGVVTDFVTNERIAFRLEGQYNSVEVSFTLEEKGEITLLSQTAIIRFKGALRILMFLLGPVFRKRIMDQSRTEFAKLKELCEEDSEG